MSNKTISVEAASKLFKVHPRTIIRAVENDVHAAFNEARTYTIKKVAETFGLKEADVIRLIKGNDELLKPEEAAGVVDTKPRTFRYREYAAHVRHGRVVRYLKTKLVNEHVKRFAA